MPLLAVVLWSCGSGQSINDAEDRVRIAAPGTEPQACPSLPTGVQQPIPIQATSEELPQLAGALMERAVADEVALYWIAPAGALYSWPHQGNEAPTELRAAPDEARTQLRLIVTNTELVWADAGAYPEFTLGADAPPGPGRLYSMPKGGGQPQLLRESPNTLMGLVAASTDRVWFTEAGPDGELLYFLDRAEGTVTQVAGPAEQRGLQVVADHVYWLSEGETSSDESGYYQDLFRQNINGGEIEFVTSIEGWSYDVIGRRVAWLHETTFFDPLVLQEQIVTFDMGTGCQHLLPTDGLTISGGGRLPLVDTTHVYWLSFNGLGTVSMRTPSVGTEAPEPPTEPSLPLLRVSVENGVLEELIVGGLAIRPGGDRLVAQTSRHIYVRGADGLVRVNKPPAD